MTTWFISDLHLDAKRPAMATLLLAFLQSLHGKADALYILGDFFEYWIGDDALQTPAGAVFLPIVQGLRAVKESGVPVYFAHGNRDFLAGEAFAEQAGCQLLPEEQVVDLYGVPTLLMHGDTLCTDDVDYQQLRQQLRDPQWQQAFLALSLPERIQQAEALRAKSKEAMQGKAEVILDVNQSAVEAVMQRHGVSRLIHGHTHRPAIHDFRLTEKPVQRIVLGDWYEQGSFLKVESSGDYQLLSEVV